MASVGRFAAPLLTREVTRFPGTVSSCSRLSLILQRGFQLNRITVVMVLLFEDRLCRVILTTMTT